jgi:hypothetical protein
MDDGEAWFILEELFEEDDCKHPILDRINPNYSVCKDCGKKIKSKNDFCK